LPAGAPRLPASPPFRHHYITQNTKMQEFLEENKIRNITTIQFFATFSTKKYGKKEKELPTK
jgi:hypothetical protein